MNDAKQITITHIPEISAIYFALLQCGYVGGKISILAVKK